MIVLFARYLAVREIAEALFMRDPFFIVKIAFTLTIKYPKIYKSEYRKGIEREQYFVEFVNNFMYSVNTNAVILYEIIEKFDMK